MSRVTATVRLDLCRRLRRAVRLLPLLAVLVLAAGADDATAQLIAACDQPFSFSYLSWQDKVTIADGAARIRGEETSGDRARQCVLDGGEDATQSEDYRQNRQTPAMPCE